MEFDRAGFLVALSALETGLMFGVVYISFAIALDDFTKFDWLIPLLILVVFLKTFLTYRIYKN